LFERIGCTGRSFVATAKAAYAGRPSATNPAESRRLGLDLLAEAGRILDKLGSVADEYRQELAERHRTGEVLAKAAEGISQNAERLLQAGLQDVLDSSAQSAPEDPEELATRLVRVASDAFRELSKSWEGIYADLENASLPPAPFALSQRQMYIETVKLFNQHRLAGMAGDRNRPARGSGAGRRRAESGAAVQRSAELPAGVMAVPVEREAAIEIAQRMFQELPSRLVEKQPAGPAAADACQKPTAAPPEALVKIVEGVGDVIRAALNQWQRSALERAHRQGPQPARADADEPTLQEELAQISRTIDQLSSLRVELARGLSPRFYLVNLLRRVSSCSPSR